MAGDDWATERVGAATIALVHGVYSVVVFIYGHTCASGEREQ